VNQQSAELDEISTVKKGSARHNGGLKRRERRRESKEILSILGEILWSAREDNKVRRYNQHKYSTENKINSTDVVLSSVKCGDSIFFG